MTKTILAIDDEPRVRALLDVVLEEAGFAVDEAGDGVEALERIRTRPPDLCVLDVMMPEMDGWEVLRRLREDLATADLPVVMLTAKGDPRARLRGWELGCDAYIPKPFEPPEIVDEIMAVLLRSPEERRALREKQTVAARAIVGTDGNRRRIGRG